MTHRGTAGTQRTALRNGQLVRHMLAFLAGATAEWMLFLGVLVYAFDRDGAAATGLASISLLVPYAAFGPIAGTLVTRLNPQRVRVAGFAVQAAGYGLAGAAAATDQSTALVVAPAAVAIAAVTTMRPSAARVLPGIVRSSGQLTVGNVWNGYCETSAALAGPAAGALLLAIGGAPAVLAGSAVASMLAVAVSLLPRPIRPLATAARSGRTRTLHVAADAIGELRRRPGALSVLAIAGSQFVVVGALDIIVVVAAEDDLGLGEAGPGWLLLAFGIGGFLSGPVAALLARRPRQTVALLVAMLAIAVASATLAGALTVAVAFVTIPVMGLSRALIDILSDLLLHRAAPPDSLGAVYSLLEVSSGVGLIVGSLLAQIAIAAAGTETALAAIAALFVLQAAVVARRLRQADASADVPVVQMSVLQDVPLFHPLHQMELEDVARAALEVSVDAGTTLIRRGDTGDRFYVVTDGCFGVTTSNGHVAEIRRGGSFGEIALLADVPRLATVTATSAGSVLAIEREPFLTALTGDAATVEAALQSLPELYDDLDLTSHSRPDSVAGG